MNINFQNITGQKASQDQILLSTEAKERTVSGSFGKNSISGSSYALDIDATGFTNNAYAQHQRSADDISQMAENKDVFSEHNFMALMANTMSEEDYNRALEDGFDLKDLNGKDAVTIVDKIKSVLLESGEVVAGYNDDLSIDKLKKITGSDVLANALKSSFHENDIPITAENAKAATLAYEQIADIKELSDAAVKFMVLNNMKPTIENIYFAAHSTNGQSATGNGFYAQEAGGYFAQKAEEIDENALGPQIEKIIEEAGLDPKDRSLKEESLWMVSQGIPLTGDNLEQVKTIKSLKFPVSEETATKAAAAAIADGKKAIRGDIFEPKSNMQKAAETLDAVENISDDDIKDVIAAGRELSIKNLTSNFSISYASVQENDERLVAARLQLEEVRLKMTVEANKQLLDSGFSIDTAPMEQLIERLKNLLSRNGEETTGKAIDEITNVTPSNAGFAFRMTISRVSIIANGPADIVGAMADDLKEASLYKISQMSETATMKFRQAGEGYEKLMTAPRADLGDSIKKAFRNVDDILKDLDQEATDENRRAVRILGYNKMEVNEENFEKVRSWDAKLQSTLDRLKPGAVFDLIRQGKNPLSMTIEELSQNLDQNSESSENEKGKSEERYAKFLFKLEHKGGITKEEKTSFIGIYRLFHTLKTTDYQAIGSLLKTDQEMTIGNLLNATRNQKASRKGMDYKVDDDFGGLTVKEKDYSPRIDEQISAAFRYYRAKAETVYENLEPEKLMQTEVTNKTLLPKLADDLKRADIDKELEREFAKQELEQIRQTVSLKSAEPTAKEMSQAGIELTYNNLEAYISEKRDRRNGNIWKKTEDMEERELLKESLSEDDYQDNYVKILERVSDNLSRELLSSDDTYIDVRAIALLQKQISVMTGNAERNSYEVPVEIDGEVVSMNVTLNSDDTKRSRMDASVLTDEYGQLRLSLFVEEESIRGMLTTTNAKNQWESEYLENVRTRLCERISEKLTDVIVSAENIAILYNAQAGPASAGVVSGNAMEGENTYQTDTKTLLTMAKAFIEAL
ncbi:MAG: hypothetical protein IJ683_06760 [Butyrivibrio sp.]|nr:DUF6240 domain-containing protein [Butyrivibrio sp.]MBR1642003.1 hypothetical protein [Butyrivibrio sp.]